MNTRRRSRTRRRTPAAAHQLIDQGVSPSRTSHSFHRACKCTVKPRRRSRTRRRTPPAAAWSVALSGRSRTPHCASRSFFHRACGRTVTTRQSRTRRRTPAAAPRFARPLLYRRRASRSSLLVGPSTCGDIGGETRGRAAAPPPSKMCCFKKGLLRRRVAPEAASPSRSDAAPLSIVAGHRREPPCR